MTHDEDRRLLTRVVIRNYKSIGGCDVRPARLSFLVGPNGAGKSNFLDALRFVADALSYTPDHALRDRGGIQEVRRRSQGRPNHFGVRLEFQLPGAHGHYAFEIGARASAGYSVQKEECVFVEHGAGRAKHTYHVQDGVVTFSSIDAPPVAASDRLYLVNASGLSAFRPVYEALSGMGFYNLNPEVIRELQPPDPGTKLKRDGVNLASVLANLEAHATTRKTCVEEYLAKVVPGVVRVSSKSIGPRETIEFRQEVRGSEHPWRFLAPNMSDGTLRALGVLVALFQGNGTTGARLIGIEEPELALHPAATGILIDALRDASERTQVLVTSHSPDLLDHEDIDSESVLAVNSTHGETHIGPLDSAGVSALRDRLYTAGELLRMDQLEPAPSQSPKQPDLFGSRD